MRPSTMLTKFNSENLSAQNLMFYGSAALLAATSSFILYKSLQKVSAYQHRPLAGENGELIDDVEPSLLEKISKMLPKPKFWS